MKRAAGFTLVELLVTVAVLGILASIAAPQYSDWIGRMQLRNAAESTLAGLQLARSEAIKMNSAVTMTLGGGGTGWAITDALGNAVQARPSGEGSAKAFLTVTQPEHQDPDLPFAVTFNGLGRMTAPNVGVSISSVDTNGGACTAAGPRGCLVVEVSQGGLVRMCDPAPGMAGTARGC